MRYIKQIITVIFIAIVFSSCGVYNQNLMFKTVGDKSIIADTLLKKIAETKSNYIIQPSDLIEVRVYTNNGERLIDPNGEFINGGAGSGNSSQLQNQQYNIIQYNVMANGTVKLPMVGIVEVKGLTTYKMDSLLQVRYSQFYQDVFVTTKCANRRVIVLGTTGGIGNLSGQVVHLPSEKMHLIEVLAMVGGLDQNAKSFNIRLIRGDLSNPNVEVIDLSTIEGMKKSNLNVQPNDIIYIERYRRGASQLVQQLAPYVSLLTLFTTMLLILKK